MAARVDFYRAFAQAVVVLIEQYGNYEIGADNQVLFAHRDALDRYNSAADLTSAAAQRLVGLQEERTRLLQAQREGWERFAGSK